MKCEFCGSELKDGVRKCKYCRMFLDGSENDQPEVECPECGCMIIEKAKICRFCGSEIEETKGTIKKTTNTDDESDSDLGKRNNSKTSFVEKIKENFVLIVLGGLFVYWIVIGIFGNSKSDENKSIDYFDSDATIDEMYFIKESNEDEESSIKRDLGEITFQPTTNGYKTRGEVGGYTIVCKIPGNAKKINEFVKNLNEKKETIAEGCTFQKTKSEEYNYDEYDEDLQNDFSPEKKEIGIFFDNSYADDGQTKNGPDARMVNLKKYLTNKRFPDGSHVQIVIPYGLGEDVKFLSSDAFYEFNIDESIFEPSNAVLSGSVKYRLIDENTELRYLPGTKILYTNGAEFSFVLDDPDLFFGYDEDKTQCKLSSQVNYDDDIDNYEVDDELVSHSKSENIEKHYVCKDAKQVYKKFREIYIRDYQNNPNAHSGNLLINAITDSPNVFDWDDLYIFSDGEFEMGEGWGMKPQIKNFKYESRVDAKQQEEFPLILFHENVYKHYNQDGVFNEFWLRSLERIKNQNKNKCTKTNVYLVGFKPYLVKFEQEAFQVLFGDCEIIISQ